MPGTFHVATIAAYPIKDKLGGGFRGVMLINATADTPKDRRASGRFDTLEAATFWAKSQAHTAYNDQGYSLAALNRKGEYQANVWVPA